MAKGTASPGLDTAAWRAYAKRCFGDVWPVKSVGAALAGVGLAISVAGCTGTPSGSALTASLEKTPAATTGTAVVLPALPLGTSPSVQGSAIAVYERVARRMLGCWFGGQGPLKKTHIFNADVAPPSSGGAADIYVHEREANPLPNQSPRGAKVFRVQFEREADERTRVLMEHSKFPTDLLEAMQRDVVAWSLDQERCEAQLVRPPPPPAPEPEKPKVKKRAAGVAR